MKKMLMISTMAVLVLAACGEEKAQSWKGTWKKVDEENSVCRDSFIFKGENNFEIQNSRVQGGEQSSGTYKHIENNDYEFDYGGGSNNFTIIVEKNTMKVQLADTICEYNKVDKIRKKYENSWE
ncbi:hypothetical protein SRABI96_03868 [Peribacillus sp. Bi96]|uniref:hypothetical protein n=1 Tax=unclassified Peribacillus TaxID=2675266 RepID=UPI001D79C807|nr:hypothetical protein [Peribacillus sp. Bi96]CAH0277181.1 hypothetical protein SRABI96_03868 [Peribacillus sp. Bi96]